MMKKMIFHQKLKRNKRWLPGEFPLSPAAFDQAMHSASSQTATAMPDHESEQFLETDILVLVLLDPFF